MGIVTEYLIKLIQRQIDERGIVVWSDPSATYSQLATRLTLPNTQMACFQGSYLALRRAVDSSLNDVQNGIPPRLVIYYPRELSTAGHALDEFIVAGILMRPGGQSLPLNTNLEVVARHALKQVLSQGEVDSLCEQIRKGQITSLPELDRLAEQRAPAGMGALTLIFGTGQPGDLALEFLINPAYDTDLLAKSTTPDLAALLSETFGADFPRDETPEELRARFRKHLLITEFRVSLEGDSPVALATVKYPVGAAREACVQLVRAWRNRRDLRDSYADAGRSVERDYNLGASPMDWRVLRGIETFPFVEESLQIGLEQAFLQAVTPELVALAETRQSSFWTEEDPNILGRWALITTAGHLLSIASRILGELRASPPGTVAGYIARYAEGPDPWCQLDTYHRTLERLGQNFDFDPHDTHASLEQLMARARQQYAVVVDTLARQFVRVLVDAQFAGGGLLYQTEIFARHVAPKLGVSKTAYVLVDALRFEMARDLAANLNKNWQVDLLPAIATPPTVTPVGMTALLPGAEHGLTLVHGPRGVLAEVAGRVFKDRAERVRYLAERINGFCDVKLEELAPASRTVREKVKAAEFVLVTSREIDLLGEADSISQAREFMDSALSKLARAFRVLAELGVQRIVVAADHGYLFVEELETDRTLPAPGGQTVDIDRRMWVGRGGQSLDDVLRVPIQALRLGGDMELATPYGLACFGVPGSRAYFHGGLALQELIIPVLVIQPAPAPVTAQIEWTLIPVSSKLTTRFFSVIVGGRAVGMFELAAPHVRVEIRARGRSISIPVSASYGFRDATSEIELRSKPDARHELEPNTITVMLSGETEQKMVAVHLIDAQTDQTLMKLEVAVAIAF